MQNPAIVASPICHRKWSRPVEPQIALASVQFARRPQAVAQNPTRMLVATGERREGVPLSDECSRSSHDAATPGERADSVLSDGWSSVTTSKTCGSSSSVAHCAPHFRSPTHPRGLCADHTPARARQDAEDTCSSTSDWCSAPREDLALGEARFPRGPPRAGPSSRRGEPALERPRAVLESPDCSTHADRRPRRVDPSRRHAIYVSKAVWPAAATEKGHPKPSPLRRLLDKRLHFGWRV